MEVRLPLRQSEMVVSELSFQASCEFMSPLRSYPLNTVSEVYRKMRARTNCGSRESERG